MSKTSVIILCLILLMVGGGCSAQPQSDNKIGTIEGRYVKDMSGDHFIMSEEHGSIIMGSQSGNEEVFDELSSGDLIRIKSEVIMESDPAQTSILDLEFVEEGGEEDLPQEELERLTEMGWTFE
ncbi:hypothetical protein ACI2JA_11285 [Alkalihalobacillus sp. NPDC078783]